MPDEMLPPGGGAQPGQFSLEDRLRELEITIDSLADLVVVVDADRLVVECNGASERVWGLPPDQVVGHPMPTSSGRLEVVDREGNPTAPETVPTVRALATGRPQRVPVLGIRRRDGTLTWAQVVAVPISPRARVVSVWTDVTAAVEYQTALSRMNVELEQRVHERTSQLESTVAELEAFSYSVSHDLRAPVRTMSALAESLRGELPVAAGAGPRDLVERIHAAALRMNGLIDVLLELSSVARSEPRRSTIDLTAMAREEFERLADRDPERRVNAAVAEGIRAFGDPQLIAIVLHNLLGNAWKFTATPGEARIQVGMDEAASRRDGEPTYFVRDNGIGFDDTDAAALFVPFGRLQSARDFEGTGVGLAIVQRIVSRHGGRVWAESQPGAGATFHFTLPAEDAPDA